MLIAKLPTRNRLLSDSFRAGFSTSVNFLALAVYNILVPNLAGIHLFGRAIVPLSAAYVLSGLIELGADNLGVIYVASSRGRDARDVAAATAVLLHKMLIASVLAGGLFFLAPKLGRFYGADPLYFKLSSLAIPLLSAQTFLVASALALGRIRWALTAQVFFAVFHSGLPLALHATGYLNEATLIMAALAAVFLPVTLLGILFAKCKLLLWRPELFPSFMNSMRKLIPLGSPRWTSFFFTSGVVLVVGKILSIEAAAYLRIAASLVKGTVTVVPLSPAFLLALFRRGLGQAESIDLRPYLSWFVTIGTLYGLMVPVVILLVGRPLLRFLYPVDFAPIYEVFSPMSWAAGPLLLKTIFDNLALSRSRPFPLVVFNAVVLIACAILTAVMGSWAGLGGAAWGFTLSAVMTTLTLYLIFCRGAFRSAQNIPDFAHLTVASEAVKKSHCSGI